MKKYFVIESRKPQYPNAIKLFKNDLVKLVNEETENENWKGWIWCEGNNNAGWVPIQLIENSGNRKGKMKDDYDAAELEIESDEIIFAKYELNGWIWAVNTDTKKEGWVPKEAVREAD